MIIQKETFDIETPTGTMRTYCYRPVAEGKFPSIIFYSEIFQQTAPIARSAAIMAGHGFVVFVPEVFHELNPIGTVLGYDDAGKDKGNNDKWTKPLEHHDTDTQALYEFVQQQAFCSGKLGAMGVCIGGHLAYRAALNPNVLSASCLYATDIHSNTLEKSSVFTDEEFEYQDLWNNYFKSTNIKSRINKKLHTQHIPKRYWKYLSEKKEVV